MKYLYCTNALKRELFVSGNKQFRAIYEVSINVEIRAYLDGTYLFYSTLKQRAFKMERARWGC